MARVNHEGLWNHLRFRTFEFERVDANSDEIPAVLSTDAPVARYEYEEVLQHTSQAIDLSRAPLPLIDSHKHDSSPYGVVDQLRIVGGKLRGVVKFGNSQRAKELLADVKAGVLRSLSIGYEIIKHHFEGNRLIATRWMPYEASCVACPADPGAGFFRSAESTMEIHEERERAAGIVRAARMFECEPRALDAIERGESVSEFRQRAMLSGALRPAALGMSQTELRRYSLRNAILAMHSLPGTRQRTFEIEVGEELAKRHVLPNGVSLLDAATHPCRLMIPPDIATRETRDMTVASAPGGGYLVGTSNLPSWVELARPRSLALSLGVDQLDGLTSNLTIARETVTPTITWLSGEGTPAAETQPSVGQISLTPKTAAAFTQFSRQLLLQSSPSVDRFLTRTLLAAMGVAVDVAVINGSGGQPTGLLNTAGLGTVNGAALALAGVHEFQTDIADALSPFCGYATTRAVAALLAQRQKATGTSSFLWEGNLYEGTLGGYRAMTSGNVPAGNLVFGDWPSILLASWGTLAIEIDPYTNFATALINARVMHSLDVGVLRPAAFALAPTVS